MPDHSLQPNRPSPPPNSVSPGGQPDVVDIAYVGLAGIWPYFTREYGVEPTRGWVVALEGIARETVEEALKRCARSQNLRPPTPGIFRALCKTVEHEASTRRGSGLTARAGDPPAQVARRYCGFLMMKRIIRRLGDSKIGDVLPTPEKLPGFPYNRVVGSVDLDDLDLTNQGGIDMAYERLWSKVRIQEAAASE